MRGIQREGGRQKGGSLGLDFDFGPGCYFERLLEREEEGSIVFLGLHYSSWKYYIWLDLGSKG